MIHHPCFSVLFVVDECRTTTQPLVDYLHSIQPVHLKRRPVLPANLGDYDVVMVANPDALRAEEQAQLAGFVRSGGSCLGLIVGSDRPLPEFFGVQPAPVGPEAELRLLFTDPQHPIAARLPEAFYLRGQYHPLQISAEQVDPILYADWRYQHSPMLVNRQIGTGQAACTTLQSFDNRQLQQVLYRLLRQLARQPTNDQTLGVGLLGYSPAVGQLHGLGAKDIDGLELRAVCDLSSRQLAEAQQVFPDIRTYASTEDLMADDAVDLVIITTPPNTHAGLSMQMLEAGKHVICEKPLAITQAETEAMLSLAEERRLHLSCHQNRRWDVDYLAIKQAVNEGLIGDLFYLESFVGSYNHPCGFWHSHDEVSGGATYDWGAHYLDWILSLLPDPPTAVICTRQNRVWHDITNADQERIQLRFAGGQEAEFIHSDIAAIAKPKWYLLGTQGAVVGRWRQVTVHDVDPVHYFETHHIPTTEMPPDLILQRRHPSGQMVEQKLAAPQPGRYPFHRNLADHLLTGEPITVPGAESAQVVTVLEAAVRSAENGGMMERLTIKN